jgi:hypothetical protein
LGDALSERHRDRIGIKALSLKPCALPALSQTLSETLRELEGSIIEGSLRPCAFGLDIALPPARRAYAPASGS